MIYSLIQALMPNKLFHLIHTRPYPILHKENAFQIDLPTWMNPFAVIPPYDVYAIVVSTDECRVFASDNSFFKLCKTKSFIVLFRDHTLNQYGKLNENEY